MSSASHVIGPRPTPASGDAAGRRVRWAETGVLVAILLLLAVAATWDVHVQARRQTRTTADRLTWRTYLERPRMSPLQVELPGRGETDVVCGPTSSHPHPRVCLQMTGPEVGGVRTVTGGYRLLPFSADRRAGRYACFGAPLHRNACAGLQRRDLQPPWSPPRARTPKFRSLW